ncbi:MAG: hypothetical protein FK730_01860 [Asgard group archaeon]|nr:hypothetical protein [Asgard group archaeon]
MKVQDVITYNQKITANITDKEMAKFFYDQDYGLLLKFLRTGPKTIKEIEEIYRLEDNEKSDKTIYRYIKDLSEAGLVVEAGQRIFTDEEHRNKSVKIYMRTAKVFHDNSGAMKGESEVEKTKEKKLYYKAYKILLDLLEEDKDFTENCIEGIIDKIYLEGQDLATKLIEKSGDEVFELLAEYDFTELNEFILNLAWLIMIYKKDFKNKLTTC